MWLLATAAFAGRVVVFDLAGDRGGRLRGQIEVAVRHARSDELVPLPVYVKAAAREGFKGARAFTPAAFQQVAGPLHLSMAVSGAVASSFYVRFLDRHGQELWSKELQTRKGLISPANAQRLAKAIEVAARQAEAQQEPLPEQAAAGAEDATAAEGAGAPEPYADGREGSAVASGQPEAGAPGGAPAPDVAQRVTGGAEASPQPPGPSTTPSAAPAPTPPQPFASAPVEVIPEEPAAFVARPRVVTVMLLGSTTFRSYCARPGVQSCADYDAQDPGARQPGPTVDFSPQVPYGGFDVGLQLFPLARLDNAARGLGLFGEYHRGFELTKVRQQGQDGQTPDTQANSTDAGYQVAAVYRWYFARGAEPLTGYVGGRVGYVSQAFEVDKSISAILPGAHHRGAVLAADLGYPIARWFRAELSAQLYPHLIPGSGETVGFGTSGSGFAYGFELGPAGELWGPLGYFFHLRYTHLTDSFEGQGVAWQSGGVTEETYLSLQWGATIQF